MIRYTQAFTNEDLHGILHLQKQNLPSALTEEEMKTQGFVTVEHSFDELKKLNDIEQHVIAKDGEKPIAYLLAMTERSQHDLPVLIPMFEHFKRISFAGKMITDFSYLVVGQVCVGREYRGQGILAECYHFYRQCYQSRYAFAITEIATTNHRSRKAHRRIGFTEIAHYTAPNGVEWVIVVWDWSHLAS